MQVGLPDVLAVAAEGRMLSGSGWLDPDVERDMLVRLRQDSSEATREKARAAFAPLPPAKKTEADSLAGYPIEHGILVLHGTFEHPGNRTWTRP
jgi:hypothetical protein